jgi:hypothetical protein
MAKKATKKTGAKSKSPGGRLDYSGKWGTQYRTGFNSEYDLRYMGKLEGTKSPSSMGQFKAMLNTVSPNYSASQDAGVPKTASSARSKMKKSGKGGAAPSPLKRKSPSTTKPKATLQRARPTVKATGTTSKKSARMTRKKK